MITREAGLGRPVNRVTNSQDQPGKEKIQSERICGSIETQAFQFPEHVTDEDVDFRAQRNSVFIIRNPD